MGPAYCRSSEFDFFDDGIFFQNLKDINAECKSHYHVKFDSKLN